MIADNELKKGNWVYFTGNGNNNPCQVKELWKKEMIVDYAGNELSLFYDSDEVQPIVLTPEILEKCGGKWYESIKHWVFHWGKNGMWLVRSEPHYNAFGVQLGEGHYKIFNYLHQWQNLFFALSENELDYKPNMK